MRLVSILLIIFSLFFLSCSGDDKSGKDEKTGNQTKTDGDSGTDNEDSGKPGDDDEKKGEENDSSEVDDREKQDDSSTPDSGTPQDDGDKKDDHPGTDEDEVSDDPVTADEDKELPENEDTDSDAAFENDEDVSVDDETDDAGNVEELCGNGNFDEGKEKCERGTIIACSDIPEKKFAEGATTVCRQDCSGWDESLCTLCGNNLRDPGETCDKAVEKIDCGNIPGKNYASGTLANCNSRCDGWLESVCTTCSNGTEDAGEVCEKGTPIDCGEIPGKNYEPGTNATCNDACTGWNDDDVCTVKVTETCGNGSFDQGEEACEKGQPTPCGDIPGKNYADSGNAICNDDCSGFDESQCTTCGNGSADAGETCEKGMPTSCADLPGNNYSDSENAICNDSCSGFDESACTTCGNGSVDAGETCEKGTQIDCSNIPGKDYKTGTNATCNNSCTSWNDAQVCTVHVEEKCGNGNVDPGETCEKDVEVDCSTLDMGFSGGTAVCNGTCSGWITEECISLLDPPTNVQASDGTFTYYVQVTWSAAAGADAYQVFRSPTPDGEFAYLGETTSTTYNDVTAKTGIRYYYAVKSLKNPDTLGSLSNSDSGFKNGNIPRPENVQATDGDHPDKIVITWDEVAEATSYEIVRDTLPNGTYNLKIGTSTDPVFEDTTALNNIIYYYKVRAYSSVLQKYGGYSVDNEPGSLKIDTPINFNATDGIFNTIRMSWNEIPQAETYRIYYSTAADGTYTQLAETDKFYYDWQPGNNTVYHFKVEAVSEPMGISYYSEPDSGFATMENYRELKLVHQSSSKGITYDTNGYLYLIKSNSILKVDNYERWVEYPEFTQEIDENGNMKYPEAVVTDAGENYLYIVDSGKHNVKRFLTADGTFHSEIGMQGSGSGQFNSPRGITRCMDGNIYVADSGNNRIVKIKIGGDPAETMIFQSTFGGLGTEPGKFDNPTYLACDSQNRIYISDTGNDRVQRCDSTGNCEVFIGKEAFDMPGYDISAPVSIAIDMYDHIYLIDRILLRQFSPEGVLTFKRSAGYGTVRVSTDPSGWHIYFTSSKGTILLRREVFENFPIEPPKNVNATDGSHEHFVRVSWDGVPSAEYYALSNYRNEELGRTAQFQFDYDRLRKDRFSVRSYNQYLGYSDHSNPDAGEPQVILDQLLHSMQYGPSSGQGGSGITMDSEGNIYIVGGTSDGFYGNSGYGSSDIFLMKLRPDGSIIKTATWGTENVDQGVDVKVDHQGNIYICGITLGDLHGNTNSGKRDIFLMKLDQEGNMLWTSQWGSSGEDYVAGIDLDASGNIYISGFANRSFEGNTAKGRNDIFVMKINSQGSPLWTEIIGTPYDEEATSIKLDAAGNIYLTGYTNGDPETNAHAGSFEIFLIKLNNDGTQAWRKDWGSDRDEKSHDLTIDSSGDLYLTGYTRGSLNGVVNYDYHIFVMKTDPDGSEIWTKIFGSDQLDESQDIEVSSTGNIFVTGKTTGDIYGRNEGSDDIFLIKLDSEGEHVWSRQWGTTMKDRPNDMIIGPDDSIFITGFTEEALDGNLKVGYNDIFMLFHANFDH